MTSISGTVAPQPESTIRSTPTTAVGYGAVITLGITIVVAMWAIGFFARLPVGGGTGAGSVLVPSWLVAIMITGVLIGGGYYARRWSGGSLWTGAQVGFTAGLVNLLIIGGVIMQPSAEGTLLAAAIWIPGSILATMALTTLGAALAGQSTVVTPVNWMGLFAIVSTIATFVLLMVGGAVTAKDAGLAVVDWPNTEGYLMWAYPLAKMTGGIYYEHSHRLFGTLVGLCTVVLAIYVTLRDERKWMRTLAWASVVLVIVQGILGGLRVTGHLTLSTDANVTAPSLTLAIVHGVLGQVFFSVMVALWVFTSFRWQDERVVRPTVSSGADHSLGLVLYIGLVVQLVLGALVRHWMSDASYVASGSVSTLVSLHIVLALIVTMIAVAVGARSWGLYQALPPLGRLGQALVILVGVQVLLGFIAYVTVFSGQPQPRQATGLDAIFTTLHQSVGALLLGAAMMHVLWSRRLLAREEEAAPTPA